MIAYVVQSRLDKCRRPELDDEAASDIAALKVPRRAEPEQIRQKTRLADVRLP
jgi:hypothetical protein